MHLHAFLCTSMHSYEPPCILMHLHAFLCTSMHSYEPPCILMHLHAFLCTSMHSYAPPCILMHLHAFLCTSMHSYAPPCILMHLHAFLCTSMHSYASPCILIHLHASPSFVPPPISYSTLYLPLFYTKSYATVTNSKTTTNQPTHASTHSTPNLMLLYTPHSHPTHPEALSTHPLDHFCQELVLERRDPVHDAGHVLHHSHPQLTAALALNRQVNHSSRIIMK